MIALHHWLWLLARDGLSPPAENFSGRAWDVLKQLQRLEGRLLAEHRSERVPWEKSADHHAIARTRAVLLEVLQHSGMRRTMDAKRGAPASRQYRNEMAAFAVHVRMLLGDERRTAMSAVAELWSYESETLRKDIVGKYQKQVIATFAIARSIESVSDDEWSKVLCVFLAAIEGQITIAEGGQRKSDYSRKRVVDSLEKGLGINSAAFDPQQ